jgi:26S proteasome regulatory subunit N1
MARSAEILVDGCAWAGTGNVLKIQKMLHICAEHSIDFSAKKKDDTTEEEEIDEEEEEVPEPSTPLQTATEPSEVPSAPSVRGRFVRVPGEPDTPAPSASTPPVGMDVDEDDLNKEGEERVKAEERQERVMRKQSIAVIGIALIAMGEEVGAEMALRHFQHLVSLSLAFIGYGREPKFKEHD